MKVIFDTNIYISWIREEKHPELLLNPFIQKYLSGIVLMELWAGAKTKKSSRIIEKFQQPYLKTKRLIGLSVQDYITAGQILSDLPLKYKNKIKSSSFINDILIALNAISIGSILFTENKNDFEIIKSYLKKLRIKFI